MRRALSLLWPLVGVLALTGPAPAVGPEWIKPVGDLFVFDGTRLRADVRMNVANASISPDGRRAALAGNAVVGGVWDLVTGSKLHGLQDGWEYGAMAFHPEGRSVAAAARTRDGFRVLLYQVGTGRQVGAFPLTPAKLDTVAFSRDGKAVAAGAGGTVYVWHTDTAKERLRLKDPGGPVAAVAFAPDDKTLASAGRDGVVRLWDLAAGKVARTCEGHRGRVFALSFTRDGKLLASGGWDGTVRLWDPATGKQVRKLEGHGLGVLTVAFAPDGKTLASGGRDGTFRVWDAATGKARLTGVAHAVAHLAVQWVGFSPDGKTLYTGEEDNSLHARDPGTGRVRLTYGWPPARMAVGVQDWFLSASVAPDSKSVALGSSGRWLSLWDLTTNKKRDLVRLPDALTAVAYAPDGKALAAGGETEGDVWVWDVAAGKLRAPLPPVHQGGLTRLAFSRDGKRLAAGGGKADPTVVVWDFATGKRVATMPGHPGGVDDLDFAPDGKALVSGGQDGKFRLWDVATGKQLWQADGARGVNNLARFAPDGKTVATCAGNVIGLRDPKTGEVSRTVRTYHDQVLSLAYSPDGQTLGCAAKGRPATVWEVATGKEKFRFVGGSVGGMWRWVDYTPDGRALITLSGGTLAIAWDLSGKRGGRPDRPGVP